MLPRLIESFDAWLHAPVSFESPHRRVAVRGLEEDRFEEVYDLVDTAFGVKRPRATYDWLYRRNPRGPARCLAALEMASDRVIAVSIEWPWPIAHGDRAHPGSMSGDRATAPDWQRQGLFGVFKDYRLRHPWRGVRIAWPNAVSRRQFVRQGRTGELVGPLRRAVAVLDARALLTRRGVPEWLARPLARGALVAQVGWERLGLGDARAVERVERFDARFDAATAAAMRGWTGYWCPHDAEFLNWRYRDHPSEQYIALAARDGERIAGYAVVRVESGAALLMELSADPGLRGSAGALLAAALARARAAGCRYLEALGPESWPHWPLLRRAGFIGRACETVMQLTDPAGLDARRIDRWHLTPGDVL